MATPGSPSPAGPAVWLPQALALHRQGRLDEAVVLYRRVLQADPGQVDALHLWGVLEAQRRQLLPAIELLESAARHRPNDPQILFNLANALADAGRWSEASTHYTQVNRLLPQHTKAWIAHGVALRALGSGADALQCYRAALAHAPETAEMLLQIGTGLLQLGDPAAALGCFDRLARIAPHGLEGLKRRGDALADLRRFDAALAAYDHALSLQPADAEALTYRGIVLAELGRHQDALASYASAIVAAPDDPMVHYNRARLLDQLQRHEEALAAFDAALQRLPSFPAALRGRANQLARLQQLATALAGYDAALALEPSAAPAWSNRGIVLTRLGRHAEALASFDRALALHPAFFDARLNRGNALMQLKRFGEATDDYVQARALQPTADWLAGQLLFARMKVCDWKDHAEALEEIAQGVAAGRRMVHPFPFLSMCDDSALQRRCAELLAAADHGQVVADGLLPPNQTPRRIRLAYVSADFHEHATAQLMRGLFARHDHNRFELFAIAYGHPPDDAMQRHLRSLFAHWIDASDQTDAEVVAQARQLGIDIAIDVKGYTQHARPGLFARRLAPVQISYLAYPGTLALPAMDYLLADPVVVPPGDEVHYNEKILRLPHCYQVNDNTKVIAEATPTRTEAGLPDQGFVFCCFNNNHKITPEIFTRWMRLLAAVPGSVLWLYEDNPEVAPNLRREASDRGIDPARLVFAPALPLAEHLARHRLADLFLDTPVYNAHTTASDALWAGLPVLTCPGRSFASRVAASLLLAVGLPELVTGSLDDYENLALALATDPARLAALREKLATQRQHTPLFDTLRSTRDIEAACRWTYDRWRQGLPPNHHQLSPSA